MLILSLSSTHLDRYFWKENQTDKVQDEILHSFCLRKVTVSQKRDWLEFRKLNC